jgi:hypothetical protein
VQSSEPCHGSSGRARPVSPSHERSGRGPRESPRRPRHPAWPTRRSERRRQPGVRGPGRSRRAGARRTADGARQQPARMERSDRAQGLQKARPRPQGTACTRSELTCYPCDIDAPDCDHEAAYVNRRPSSGPGRALDSVVLVPQHQKLGIHVLVLLKQSHHGQRGKPVSHVGAQLPPPGQVLDGVQGGGHALDVIGCHQ